MHKEAAGVKNGFISNSDALATLINAKANSLYEMLLNIDAGKLDTAEEYKAYFIKHHLGKRLFFSLQSSAHIIYNAVKKCGKPVNEITFIDYGAGLGTLFMLAGMMGFKKIVYNDYLPEWHQPAKALCHALQIQIDTYVEGGIENVVSHASGNNIRYDIVASRNVLEHIYSLPVFYTLVYQHNPDAITYSTTTANYHNPAMRLLHYYIHYKAEKVYCKQRIDEIKKILPSVTQQEAEKMAVQTRGKAMNDFTNAVSTIANGGHVEKEKSLRSNTCDCINGIWIEHLLTKKEYAAIVSQAGLQLDYTAGFWDTHYQSKALNLLAGILNKIIGILGKKRGIILSPFVNIATGK